MVDTGLIGFGKWGKIIYEKLIKISDVKFVCNSSEDYLPLLNQVDWVVVATPNITHYDIVKSCLKRQKNVFCEKPLTLSYKQSKELYKLAKENKVHLYVDDIQNYRKTNFEFKHSNLVERRKKSQNKIKDVLFDLVYHDVYLLYNHIKDFEISEFKVFDKEKVLNFEVDFQGKKVEFIYDLNYDGLKHEINGVSQRGDDDVLSLMLFSVFNEEVDFVFNKKLTLFTSRTLELFKIKIFNKIAVVGGGIFGSTAAWYLSERGFEVDLFEKNKDIMLQASAINQYRLHSGYHYPRSKSTAKSSVKASVSFTSHYGKSLCDPCEHYYCISSKDSLLTPQEYLLFLDDLMLPYEIVDKLEIINNDSVDLIVKVKESLFDPHILKEEVWEKLRHNNVGVRLGAKTNLEQLKDYDYRIVATYSGINSVLTKQNEMLDYQFEFCEKPIFKFPPEFNSKSIVIMDGPFTCIDPFSSGNVHVVGNVVHAIHDANIGKIPKSFAEFSKYMNKGLIQNPTISKKDLFLKTLKHFFKNIDAIEYLGSMFTIRTVLPKRDYDDARPTTVQKNKSNTFVIFSGKIGTCVDASETLYQKILQD